MSLFNKKSKEEKVLEEIKKKKEQMDKLKEEIVKMGKLVLKDGKLIKIEDVQKEEPNLGELHSIPEVTQRDIDVDEMVQQERLKRQQAMATLVNNPVASKQTPPPMSQEEYNALKRQQEMYAYQQQMAQQQAMAEQQEAIRRQEEELYQQQQYRQQPQQYQQPQPIPMIGVSIEMITGTIISVQVPGDKVDSFIEGLNTAIDNQSSFPINNKVINGKNIVSYTLE